MIVEAELEGSPVSEADLLASICRNSFWEFVQEFWECVPGAGSLVPNWHMELMANELQVMAERVFKWEPAPYDEVFNQPPGTSKSTVASILFHPWMWTRMPTARVLVATNTHDLVIDLAEKARAVINSEKYKDLFPEIKLAKDTIEHFSNTLGGDRLTSTVSGRLPTGFHAHALIGDDLINPQKALSIAEMQNVENFVRNYFPTRMVDKLVTIMFLVMQRIGAGDPTDMMLKIARQEGARPVRHFCLPAELLGEGDMISPPELANYYTNNLMDPVRLPKTVLRAFKARGEHFFASQFRRFIQVLFRL